MDASQKIQNLLTWLGDTPDMVAEKLLAEGCYGNNYCMTCPVAMLIWRAMPGLKYLSVTPDVVTYRLPGEEEGEVGSDYLNIYMPDPVRRFIKRFDNARKYGPLYCDRDLMSTLRSIRSLTPEFLTA